nr:hypothetical protein [Pseudomonas protegens]
MVCAQYLDEHLIHPRRHALQAAADVERGAVIQPLLQFARCF